MPAIPIKPDSILQQKGSSAIYREEDIDVVGESITLTFFHKLKQYSIKPSVVMFGARKKGRQVKSCNVDSSMSPTHHPAICN